MAFMAYSNSHETYGSHNRFIHNPDLVNHRSYPSTEGLFSLLIYWSIETTVHLKVGDALFLRGLSLAKEENSVLSKRFRCSFCFNGDFKELGQRLKGACTQCFRWS